MLIKFGGNVISIKYGGIENFLEYKNKEINRGWVIFLMLIFFFFICILSE